VAERIDRLLREKREEILRIAHQRGAYNVRVFGSVARGEAGPGSDIDLLIDYEPGYNLFDHSGLKQDLEKLLGREVDLVTEGCLREHIRSQVLKQAVLL
jgi:predicted nucleotidyltransferase